MAQDWAKWFYSSKSWKQCREAYKASKHYLCEKHQDKGELVPGRIVHHKVKLTRRNIHDPTVTLNWDNLWLLCDDCHAEEHKRARRATRPGFAFDEQGRLVQEG